MSEPRLSGYAVIVNKKFWDGLPADIRTELEGAMKDATKYANDIAKKENDDALRSDQGVRQDRDHHADRRGEGRMEQGAAAGAQGDGGRVGKEMIEAVYKETGFKP